MARKAGERGTKMTEKQFALCVSEMDSYYNRDAYVSALSLSSIWGDAEDAAIPQERIDFLIQLWDACHRSVKEIAAASGLSNRIMAVFFCIAQRRMESWCGSAKRSCPGYVRLMMQECLGLLQR